MPFALGQGETTSAIAGQVTDATGAGIAGAAITLVRTEDGSRRSALTDQTGRFSFPQLKPGSYSVRAIASSFEEQTRSQVSAGLGQTQTVNFVLSIKAAKENVIVTTDAPLINTENPNTATTLNAKAIENLPNPGSDLTYPAQFAPGALINTAGSSNDFVGGSNGYGNVQFNGLPALSNAYIVDGLETNDPLTNLNSGLSTNLVLGLNSIAEVTVNTTSYAVDQGRYGAAQINYITKSGGNNFHGNLYQLWNGSHLNAADYFTNSTPGNQKPRSNVNHFGGSLGGPIVHDKLFFFFDGEWLRIALPIVTPITVPSPQFQNYVLSQLPRGGTDPVTGARYPAAPQLVPFYQRCSRSTEIHGERPCRCWVVRWASMETAAPIVNMSRNRAPIMNRYLRLASIKISARTISSWYRFQADTGVQAAYTDPINPLFDATSPQPLYSFAAGYTHLFSPKLVNYFNPAFSWYSSLFGPADQAKTLAAFPIVLQGVGPDAPFTPIGGQDNNWVQGRRAARFQISDTLSLITGRHEFKFGLSGRILRLNDFDFSTDATPLVTYTTLAQFIYGVASTATASYPIAASQPFNYLNLDLFALDTITAELHSDLDHRHSRGPQLQSGKPAQFDRAAGRLF